MFILRRLTTPNIQDDIITTYRPIPCHLPNTFAHTATLNSSRCFLELFHSLPVLQPSSGPWSTIDRYEQFPPLARENDFTQRTNNTYVPNHHIAHMTAPNVLATPAISDNYNGLVPRIREVRNSSCNFPDICWSTLAHDDPFMAQAPPRAA